MEVALVMQVQDSDALYHCTWDDKLFLEFCRLVFRDGAHSDTIAQCPYVTPTKPMTGSSGDVGVVTLPAAGKTATSTLPRSPVADGLPCLLRTDMLSSQSEAVGKQSQCGADLSDPDLGVALQGGRLCFLNFFLTQS